MLKVYAKMQLKFLLEYFPLGFSFLTQIKIHTLLRITWGPFSSTSSLCCELVSAAYKWLNIAFELAVHKTDVNSSRICDQFEGMCLK